MSITWIERKQDKIISHQKQDNICNKSSSSLRGKRKIVRGRERGRGSNPLAFFPFSLYPFWHLLHSLQFKPRGKSSHKQSFQLFYVLVMMRFYSILMRWTLQGRSITGLFSWRVCSSVHTSKYAWFWLVFLSDTVLDVAKWSGTEPKRSLLSTNAQWAGPSCEIQQGLKKVKEINYYGAMTKKKTWTL